MNVYDFDGTIYYTDCTVSFAFWCAKRYPGLWLTYVPGGFMALLLYQLRILPRYKFERKILSYLGMVEDFDQQIEAFWDKHQERISPWYLAQKRPDDLIISASPDCLIGPIARRLGVNYVASEYDRECGVFLNNVMFGKEKARYLIEKGFPKVEHFYSDSLSDAPLALCAEKAHYVTEHGQKVNDWPEMKGSVLDEVRRLIDIGTKVRLSEVVHRIKRRK